MEENINKFRGSFSREASFKWFVMVIIWFMTRTDFLGLTGLIRELYLSPKRYTSLLNFFHAESWNVEDLSNNFVKIIEDTGCIYEKDGYYIIIGDGIKKGKEARKMPGVKKHHQESENTTKPTYIHGHLYGVVGLVVGNDKHKFCAPVSAQIQNGVSVIRDFGTNVETKESHVVQMIKQSCEVAKSLDNKSLVVLDRYFLTENALETLKKFRTENNNTTLEIVTRAKSNAVAVGKLEDRIKKPGPGRPPKYGDKIKLFDLFQKSHEQFEKASLTMYGELVEVSFLTLNLNYNNEFKLRYVLVEYDNKRAILVSTDLELDPKTIIELYSFRQKIEVTFKTLNQTIGGFDYHFWNKDMPKLNRFKKKEDPDPLINIKDKNIQKKLKSTLKAIEGYVTMACIATGFLQILSLVFSETLKKGSLRWLRTPSTSFQSEATISATLRNYVHLENFAVFKNKPISSITQIIRDNQNLYYEEDIC